MTTADVTPNEPLSEKAKLFIKVHIATSASRFFFWVTLLSLLPAIFGLVVITQGEYQLEGWAVALVFVCLSVILGLTMWRWVIHRDSKKALSREELLYGNYINAELIDEVVEAPKFKLYNGLSVLRLLFAFIGILFINMAITTLYGVATYQREDFEPSTVLTQGIIGLILIVASFIANVAINQAVKTYNVEEHESDNTSEE